MAEQISEDQAQEALQQLRFNTDEEAEAQAEETVEEQPAEETAELEAGTEETQPSEEQPPEVEEPEPDEAEVRFNAKLEALQHRHQENERILRDRYLRKSTSADNALKILKASRTEDGVSEADVDRVINEMEGTMHPASASYVAPAQPEATEDQALVLNSFLNDKGMTIQEATEFGNWVRSDAGTVMSAAEQAVAGQSLDGFLRLAHTRWQEGLSSEQKNNKRSDAVGAVRSIKRTQRAAAKAASAKPTAPRKQPAGPKTEVDYKKMTKSDVSALLRESVEQYRR